MPVGITGAVYMVGCRDVVDDNPASGGYLAVGDSITAFRAGVYGYVDRLATMLAGVGIHRIQNIGLVGATTQTMLDQWPELAHCRVATVMLGANDSAPPAVSNATYEANLRAIHARIMASSPGATVVFCTPSLITARPALTGFAGVVRSVAASLGCPCADVYAATDALSDDLTWITRYTLNQDGVHPTSDAHATIAATVWTQMQGVL